MSTNFTTTTEITIWDWLIFFTTIILPWCIGFYGMHRQKKSAKKKDTTSWAEYLVMGRRLTLPFFVATLVSSWYGNIFSVTQIAFQYGIYAFFTQGIFWYFSYFLFAFLLAKYIRKKQILSFSELFSELVGREAGKFSAVLIFIKTLPITCSLGVGLFLKTLFPLSFPLAVAIGLLFVGVYSSIGGFSAIIYADLVHAILMYVGIIAVVLCSFLKFGGYSYLVAHCPASYFSPVGNFSLANTMVWFFIAITTTFLSPIFYQKCLSAKSDKVAIYGIVVAIFFWFLFDLCTTSIGLYARAYYPHATAPNSAFSYCLHILPVGAKGMFLGGVLATMVSTVDSFLFLSSSTLAYDLNLFAKLPKYLVRILTISITGGITFIVVVFYQGSFELTWRMIKGYFAACIFFPFIISCFYPYVIPPRVFSITAILVLIGMALWTYHPFFPIDVFYVGQSIAIFCVLTGIMIHYFFKKW